MKQKVHQWIKRYNIQSRIGTLIFLFPDVIMMKIFKRGNRIIQIIIWTTDKKQ